MILVEKILNLVLKDNQGVRSKLRNYNGYSFKISGAVIPIELVIDNEGYLLNSSYSDFNCEINFNLEAYYKLLSGADKVSLLNSISITGDRDFAIELLNILAGMQPYFLETKHPLFNNGLSLLINLQHKLVMDLLGKLTYMAQAFAIYLKDESKWLSSKSIIENFTNEVDDLVSSYNRVNAKFEQFKRG